MDAATPAAPGRAPAAHHPWYTVLYIQVLIAIALGILLGHFFPETRRSRMKPLGDGFIALIKMMIAPVIFCTVVHGIASMSDLKQGRPCRLEGAGLFRGRLDRRAGDRTAGRRHCSSPAPASTSIRRRSTRRRWRATSPARQGRRRRRPSAGDHSRTPSSARFASGDLLQVLLVSILIGLRRRAAGRGRRARSTAPSMPPRKLFFGIIRIIVRAAPLGAFGAMAFTIGDYGLGSLVNLGALIATFYLTSILFVLIVLGAIAQARRVLDPALHRLHQGRAADRARHQFIGNRAAADDLRRCSGSARRSRLSAWSFRPATASTWTAPTST